MFDLPSSNGSVELIHSSTLDFDENYVEFNDGKIQLKPLDLEHSGDDFYRGSHVGSHVPNNQIQMRNTLSLAETHVNTVLPTHSSNLVGYWRFDGSFNDSSGSSINGNPQGDVSVSGAPKIGAASAVFDGSGDYLTLGDNFDYTNNFTVAAWFRTSTSNTRIFSRISG